MKKNKKYILFFFLYSFFLLFFCSEFSPLYEFNFSPDTNIYYIIGKGILFDKVPYKDLFDHKGPFIFFIYALGYFISPDSLFGMFILVSLFLFISITFIFFLSKLFINKYLSVLSACMFPIMLMIFMGTGGSAEEFILTFLIVSLFFFIYYFQQSNISHNPRMMFIHGMMLGLVFLIKLNLIVFWIFPLLFIFFNLIKYHFLKNFIANVICLLLGSLVILLPISLYFLYHDALLDLFDAYIILNSKYGGLEIISYWYFLGGLISRFYSSFSINYICFSIVILGILQFVFSSFIKQKTYRLAVMLSFVSTSFMLYSPPVAMSYYYIIFCVFFPLGTISIFYFFDKKINLRYSVIKAFTIIGVFICFLLCVFKQDFFGYSIDNLVSRDFPKSISTSLSKEISKKENSTLLCAGLDDGLSVFFLAKLLPNTKYFFSPNVKYEDYPMIADGQLYSISNKDIDFVIMTENFRYKYEYDSCLIKSGYVINFKESNYLLYELSDTKDL